MNCIEVSGALKYLGFPEEIKLEALELHGRRERNIQVCMSFDIKGVVHSPSEVREITNAIFSAFLKSTPVMAEIKRIEDTVSRLLSDKKSLEKECEEMQRYKNFYHMSKSLK